MTSWIKTLRKNYLSRKDTAFFLGIPPYTINRLEESPKYKNTKTSYSKHLYKFAILGLLFHLRLENEIDIKDLEKLRSEFRTKIHLTSPINKV